MSSEETPLLRSTAEIDHDAVYGRFTPARKRVIVAVVALTGTFPSELSYVDIFTTVLSLEQCLRPALSSPSSRKSPTT